MTVSEAGKGIVKGGYGTYQIGFVNDKGNDDETEYSAYSLKELSELFSEFCRENGFNEDTVTYIRSVNV